MIYYNTERLKVILLDSRMLKLWINHLPKLEEELKVKYDGEELDDCLKTIIIKQAEKCEKSPENTLWLSFFWLIEKNTNKCIGTIDLKNHNEETVEIGYGLGENHFGKGYMTEAVKGLLEISRKYGIKMVLAETEESNIKSQNVLLRNGFIPLNENKPSNNLWWFKDIKNQYDD